MGGPPGSLGGVPRQRGRLVRHDGVTAHAIDGVVRFAVAFGPPIAVVYLIHRATQPTQEFIDSVVAMPSGAQFAGDGTSFEDAVRFVALPTASVAALEWEWLTEIAGQSRESFTQQSLTSHGGRMFDVFEFVDEAGARSFYFDVSGFV